MKKISGWCILVTVLFLLLGLSKVALASSQGKAKKDPDMARLEKKIGRASCRERVFRAV